MPSLVSVQETPSVGGVGCFARWAKLSPPPATSNPATTSSNHARVVSTDPFTSLYLSPLGSGNKRSHGFSAAPAQQGDAESLINLQSAPKTKERKIHLSATSQSGLPWFPSSVQYFGLRPNFWRDAPKLLKNKGEDESGGAGNSCPTFTSPSS